MKPVGSKFEYENERNDDLMSVYHRFISSCSTIRLRELMEYIVNSPSQRFWVSEERASIVISSMMKGENLSGMSRMKREMFTEIHRRVMAMADKNPDMPLSEIVYEVIRQPAPRFYLTPGSAKVIIHKIKKKWFEERRRKLHHLF